MAKLKNLHSGESRPVEAPPGIKPDTRALGGGGAYVHGEGMGRVRLTDVVSNYRMVRGTSKGDASKNAMLREGLMLAGMRHGDRDPRTITLNTKLRMAMGEMTRREARARIHEARHLERRDRLDAELSYRHMQLEDARLDLGDALVEREKRVKEVAGPGAPIDDKRRENLATAGFLGDATKDPVFRYAVKAAVNDIRDAKKAELTARGEEQVALDVNEAFIQTHLGWGEARYREEVNALRESVAGSGGKWTRGDLIDWQRQTIAAEIEKGDAETLGAVWEEMFAAEAAANPLLNSQDAILDDPKNLGTANYLESQILMELVVVAKRHETGEASDGVEADRAFGKWLAGKGLDEGQIAELQLAVRETLFEGQMAPWGSYYASVDAFDKPEAVKSILAEEESARIQHAADVLAMTERDQIDFAANIKAYFLVDNEARAKDGRIDSAASELLYGDKPFAVGGSNSDLRKFFEPRPRDSHADVLDEMGRLNADEVIKRLREQRAFLNKPKNGEQRVPDSEEQKARFAELEAKVRKDIEAINTAIEFGAVPSLFEQRGRQALASQAGAEITSEDYQVEMAKVQAFMGQIAPDSETYGGGLAQECRDLAEIDPDATLKGLARWNEFWRSRTVGEGVRDLIGRGRRIASDAHDVWNAPGMTDVRKTMGTLKSATVGSWDVAKHLAEALLRLLEQSVNGLHQGSEAIRAGGRGDGSGAASNMMSSAMALGRAPISAVTDAATGLGKTHDTVGETRNARHKTTDAKNRSLAVIDKELGLIKSGKDENVAQAQEMVKSVHEYTETVRELLSKAGDMVGGATENDRKNAAREVKVIMENLEENLKAIERDNPGMAETLRKHTLVSPEAITRAMEAVSAAGAHRNERVRKAMISCGITSDGAHGEFSSVVDFGEWGNNAAIQALKTGKRSTSESGDDPLESAGLPTPKGMTVGQPRLAMSIGGDGMAKFSLVGCKDWGEPHHSEGVQMGAIRVQDMEAIWQSLQQPDGSGKKDREAQLASLELLEDHVQKRIQTLGAINPKDPAAQDLMGMLGSISTMKTMVEVAEVDGMSKRQLDGMREIHRMGKALNGNFAALTISNRSHQEMVTRFNGIIRDPDKKYEMAPALGERREQMERDIQANRLRWPGGWSVDPVILVNAHANQIDKNIETLKSMNTYQRMKAFMRRHHRVRQERDEMVELASMLQIS